MLIDNKKNRYPGRNLTTVCNFIQEYAGKAPFNSAVSPIGNFDIVTGYFTIRALSYLYRNIPEQDHFRIISSELIEDQSKIDHIIDLLNGDGSITTTIQLSQYAQEAIAFLERDTVEVRAVVSAFCHAKAYMFKPINPRLNNFYITGSSNLTDAGLGLKKSANVELNVAESFNSPNNDFDELCNWFDDVWKYMAKEEVKAILDDRNKKETINVKEFFIRKIKEYYKKYTPEDIYYKILFELFNGDIDIDNSIEHRQDMSLLQTSVIWKTLFNYQQKGVISLIKMLRKYNGAILADAVGLGKTFSALAVIKYFQTQGFTTVLLCPKKLEHNWKQYLRGNDSRFEKDEFEYKVRFHTDLQNDRLEQYDRYRLSYLQRREKLLIVIDESHNLRNEKSGRYNELMTKLIQQQAGREHHDVKVLLLSATPINTGLNDIKGQFNIIGKGVDNAFNTDDFGVESLSNLFRDAQGKYNAWCNDENRTIGQFIEKLPPKFFNLTDKLIVARTRKLIEHTLGENLGFPEKVKPENHYKGVDSFGTYNSAEEIYKAIESIDFTAYQPSIFLYETRDKARKGAKKDWQDDVNREKFLAAMMCSLFMKRLESSWYSCLSTVEKVLYVHKLTLDKAINYRDNGIDDILRSGYEPDDYDDDYDDTIRKRRQIKVSDLKNLGGFIRALQKDVKLLKEICDGLKTFESDYHNNKAKDEKLDILEQIIKNKQTAQNKKIVIFTAYSDTAQFLYQELVARGISKIASASGSKINTTGHHPTQNFTQVLESFAPYSKLYKEKDWTTLYLAANLDPETYYDDDKKRWNVSFEKWKELIHTYDQKTADVLDDEIDILIATDCLSEGQNLQDADIQVNYDIHWNPVRLIQRFGRIDRIGSPNRVIKCINFWPAASFEDYLHLQTRVQNRMAAMNLVGSETQEISEAYQKMVEDNPLVDKNANRLLQELTENSISDIEQVESLSLKDFSLETFRQDLIDYLEKNRDKFRQMPNGIFSGFTLEDNLFAHIPESLVAVVGYPARKDDSNKPYTEIYLLCQPVDPSHPATAQEMNRMQILDLLRSNKGAARCLPSWIEPEIESSQDDGHLNIQPDDYRKAKLERLSGILKSWMKAHVPAQAVTDILEIVNSIGPMPKKPKNSQMLDDKFKIENFDLITWEYISK